MCHELKPSIVVVMETFLDATGAVSFTIPGYLLSCRRDRPKTNSKGGIAIYCLDVAVDSEISEGTRSCSLQHYLNSTTLSKLSEFGAQSVLFLGDFNVHYEEWLISLTTDAAGH